MEINELLSKLNKAVPGSVLEKRRFGRSGDFSLWIEGESVLKVAQELKNDPSLELDWLENMSAIQMEDALVITYFVASTKNPNFLIIRASVVPENVLAEVKLPSVSGAWAMAEPFEEEIRELFGVRFLSKAGGADAGSGFKRLPGEWRGFPLRKDYTFPTEVYGIRHVRKVGRSTDENGAGD